MVKTFETGNQDGQPQKLPQPDLVEGHSGEWHQQSDTNVLSTNQGIPVSDNQNSLRANKLGPTLLEDFIFREKMTHFDHERIPERVVHARGSAAHGFFELTESLSQYTTARVLTEVGEQTPVFTRFSTVVGKAGSMDTPRDVRGFAVKFYTQEGNWDLVGNNIPVFFIQDAIKFPDVVHAVKMEPDRGFPQASSAHDTFWDFISLTPESMHMIMWIMSDRTLPRSYRMIEGFGVHSFRLVNAAGESTFVKFHWRPKLGLQSTLFDEAVKIAGADPDYHRRDLFEAIGRGDFPEWELAVQLFTEEEAATFPFDHLDSTKLIPEELVPLKVIGRMVLDRWPNNFFAETEQVAYCTANVVPGIDFSNDPLLQGRNFSYLDTQLLRLGGPNFHQIPINAPKCPFANYQRDGFMQMAQPAGRVSYEPNSLLPDGPRENPRGYRSARVEEHGTKDRIRSESFSDHYSQARQFFMSQTIFEQAHIASALVFELSKVEHPHIREAIVGHLRHIEEDLAQRVARGIGMTSLPDAPPKAATVLNHQPSPPLRTIGKNVPILTGRSIGVLIAEESDRDLIDMIINMSVSEGATCTLIASHIGDVELSDKSVIHVGAQLAGTPSVLFDAVAVILSVEATTLLCMEAAAVDFVRDAFGHLKAILRNPGAQGLLDKAGVITDEAIIASDNLEDFFEVAKTRKWEREKLLRTLA
jgi:catalase